MEQLVECVPNVSEAHDEALLDAIAAGIVSTPGVVLLDRTSDRDHARSVFTLAGSAGAVSSAAEGLVQTAVAGIDLRAHVGEHPRIGAVDVVPFVPLGEISMADCVALARAFGAAIAERYELPVFLYGEAAASPERRLLSRIRAPRFEGLAEAMARPGGGPDYGPARPHPTAGATAVGVRPFLIAYNVRLAGNDVRVARRIAEQMRERDGGLPRVQALGLELRSQGCLQLSMNLLDYQTTPLWRVWEEALRVSAAAGVDVIDSELIGLAPMAALTDVADHIGAASELSLRERVARAGAWLRIKDFDPDMALELRLQAAGGDPG